jgi:hypothetical protein
MQNQMIQTYQELTSRGQNEVYFNTFSCVIYLTFYVNIHASIL